MPRCAQDRQHLLRKTPISPVEDVQRHLTGIEGKVVCQHLEMNLRVFVAGETEKPHLALPFGFEQCVGRPVRRKVPIGIVVIHHFVNLPEIEVVGLQAPERFVELLQGNSFVASVRADLGHEEGLLPAALQPLAHEFFRSSAIVFPRVVQESDPRLKGLMQHPDGFGLAVHTAPMGATEAESRHLYPRLPQHALRDLPRRSVRNGTRSADSTGETCPMASASPRGPSRAITDPAAPRTFNSCRRSSIFHQKPVSCVLGFMEASPVRLTA